MTNTLDQRVQAAVRDALATTSQNPSAGINAVAAFIASAALAEVHRQPAVVEPPADQTAVLAATLREVLDTFSPMKDTHDGPVAYYDGSADIEPEQYDRWRAVLDAELRRGFLTLLYALRAMANASGELSFHGDRQPIRIQDIAKACGASEKDARRYLDAAIRAGVVVVKGERKRGRPTLYVIVPHPFPDWPAAEDHLKSTARKPGKRPAPWSPEAGSSGDRDPNQFGGPRPELTDGTAEEVRVTATRMGSGDRDPNGSGHRDPNNPGVTHVSTQDGAEVGFQPQVVGAPHEQIDPHEHHDDAPRDDTASDDPDTWRRCTTCRRPILPDPKRPGRTIHARCEATTQPERHSA